MWQGEVSPARLSLVFFAVEADSSFSLPFPRHGVGPRRTLSTSTDAIRRRSRRIQQHAWVEELVR